MIDKHDAYDKKIDMCIKAHWRCFRCGRHLRLNEAQLAHRIPKHKKYIKKYGADVIHNTLNMFVSCDKCNSYALIDPATHPIEAEKLVEKIIDSLR